MKIFSARRTSRRGELIFPGSFSNFKTYAHVGQADMGRSAKKRRANCGGRLFSPLLAGPAGAKVFQLTPPIPNTASPVGLSNRKESFKPMPNPLYTNQDIRPAFHLRYTWTGWPTEGTNFPSQPDDALFQELDTGWTTDNLKRFSIQWNADEIRPAFATVSSIAPTLFVARVKGLCNMQCGSLEHR